MRYSAATPRSFTQAQQRRVAEHMQFVRDQRRIRKLVRDSCAFVLQGKGTSLDAHAGGRCAPWAATTTLPPLLTRSPPTAASATHRRAPLPRSSTATAPPLSVRARLGAGPTGSARAARSAAATARRSSGWADLLLLAPRRFTAGGDCRAGQWLGYTALLFAGSWPQLRVQARRELGCSRLAAWALAGDGAQGACGCNRSNCSIVISVHCFAGWVGSCSKASCQPHAVSGRLAAYLLF